LSPRARSWAGGILFALGVFAFFGGSLFPGLAAIAYAGVAAVLLALFLIGWAFRDVTRQIGASHARFEAQLRSEAEREKGGHPPQGK
jgi:hypothetical protein